MPIGEGQFSLAGQYRYNGERGAELFVVWYDDSSGPSFSGERFRLPDTGRGWRRLVRHLDAPERASHVNLFATFAPPERADIQKLDLDDLRLIERTGDAGGREHGHLAVDGPVAARLAADPPAAPGAQDWSALTR